MSSREYDGPTIEDDPLRHVYQRISNNVSRRHAGCIFPPAEVRELLLDPVESTGVPQADREIREEALKYGIGAHVADGRDRTVDPITVAELPGNWRDYDIEELDLYARGLGLPVEQLITINAFCPQALISMIEIHISSAPPIPAESTGVLRDALLEIAERAEAATERERGRAKSQQGDALWVIGRKARFALSAAPLSAARRDSPNYHE